MGGQYLAVIVLRCYYARIKNKGSFYEMSFMTFCNIILETEQVEPGTGIKTYKTHFKLFIGFIVMLKGQ